MKYTVYHGGLMRCCLATLDEFMATTEVEPKEGDVLPCKHHPADNSMVFRDGGWRWNYPEVKP